MELCLALDLPDREANLALAAKVAGKGLWLKVGFRSYIRDGKPFLEELKRLDPECKIFLDLKLYDIPNTMADAAEEIADLGVAMFNVHASAGTEAMKTVMKRLEGRQTRPLVLAVTALTSFTEEGFSAVYNAPLAPTAEKMAVDAYDSGLDGVVCSVHESRMIKNATAPGFLTLTPGVRPEGSDPGDQKRVATPATAKEEQVDYIVVGRPIYKAENPAAVVNDILKAL